jgi:hypothetical protein
LRYTILIEQVGRLQRFTSDREAKNNRLIRWMLKL